jgi:hypothetical protein
VVRIDGEPTDLDLDRCFGAAFVSFHASNL